MLEEFGLMMKITQDNKTDMQEEMKVWAVEGGGRGERAGGRRILLVWEFILEWQDDAASVWSSCSSR